MVNVLLKIVENEWDLLSVGCRFREVRESNFGTFGGNKPFIVKLNSCSRFRADSSCTFRSCLEEYSQKEPKGFLEDFINTIKEFNDRGAQVKINESDTEKPSL